MLLLLLYVGNEAYACDIEKVVEIVPWVRLKKIPHKPSFVSGLLNFGGEPVPVVDLCELIEGRPSQDCLHSRIIVFQQYNLDKKEVKMGLIAERVTEMIDRDQEQFRATGVKLKDLPFLGGVLSAEQEEVQMIRVEKLFAMMEDNLFAMGKISHE